jgi:disulfide bond formation protein DsbB
MAETPALQRPLALLNWLALTAMLAVICAILLTAMGFQYLRGEIPCPLCLLERAAMFGVCFGILLQLRSGFSYQNTGFSLLSALFLLIVSTRQTLLDIYPRPGHEYIGSAVFGLHMPVWSIVIALALLIGFALKLAVLGGERHLQEHPAASFPAIARATALLGPLVIALCAINLISVVVQCGLGQCHTTGYLMIDGPQPGG